MAQTAADRFAETFAAVGATRIYRVVGDSLNGLTDALHRQVKIESVHVQNEGAGTSAAGAAAHLTGELAVCADSCGPGNLYPINGLFGCHPSPVSMLGIAAQMSSVEIGAGIVSKTHSQAPFQECGYYYKLVSARSQMPRTPEAEIRQAVTKRGAPVVVMPGDVGLQPTSGRVGDEDRRASINTYGPVNAAAETLSACFHQSRLKRTGVC
jgi:pyruvate dehydrogenase (quinone)